MKKHKEQKRAKKSENVYSGLDFFSIRKLQGFRVALRVIKQKCNN